MGEIVDTEKQPKKRGRKPSAQKKKFYFGDEEEQAFHEFMNSDNQSERDMIFKKKLYPAFTKLVESIIRTYTLFVPLEDYEETFSDTLSFLVTKLSNFDVTKGYKLYSYCGTICKNYLLYRRTQYRKKCERQISYDLLFPTAEKDERHTNDTDDALLSFNTELIHNTLTKVKEMLNGNNISYLTENEQKIGYALIEILGNWDEIFTRLENKKFNKTSVLFFIKEYTHLNSKEIRDGMKKYKNIYFHTREKLLQN